MYCQVQTQALFMVSKVQLRGYLFQRLPCVSPRSISSSYCLLQGHRLYTNCFVCSIIYRVPTTIKMAASASALSFQQCYNYASTGVWGSALFPVTGLADARAVHHVSAATVAGSSCTIPKMTCEGSTEVAMARLLPGCGAHTTLDRVPNEKPSPQ